MSTLPPRHPMSPDDTIVGALSLCLPHLGEDHFIDELMEVMALIGASQITAFSYEKDRVECLLSRNFISNEMGGTLAALYLGGWYQRDPLYGEILKLADGTCTVRRLDEMAADMDPDYLATFFDRPGFRSKLAIIVAQRSLRMVLNLYFAPGREGATEDGEAMRIGVHQLLGRMLATHFLRSRKTEFPVPLAVLSERERQVCMGMLAGKKAEVIAGEIGIGPSSVVTYRQRAYQKLGISSRSQLFAICSPSLSIVS